MLFLIFDGGNWRSHSLQAPRYTDGCWAEKPSLAVNSPHLLTSLEGLLITIDEKGVGWTWREVGPIVSDTLEECDSGSDIPRILRMVAKMQSYHTRSNTSNKPYRSNWDERVADLVQAISCELDRGRALDELTKYYLSTCDTPKPRSRGICFADVYMGDDFKPYDRSRENNCYTEMQYPFYTREEDERKKGSALGQYRCRLALSPMDSISRTRGSSNLN